MNRTTNRTGLLLVNLGTPDAPTTAAVRPYLRQFLFDPRVINIPAPLRWLLLEGFILRTRPAKSAAAYRTIWTDRGSPLLFHSQDLTARVSEQLPDVEVALAMRYGKPSIESALGAFRDKGVDRIVIFPLYPQYSSAATGSTIEEVYRLSNKMWAVPPVCFVPAFYDDDGFLEAFAARGKQVLDRVKPDHVLMSFHGLPEDHITRCDPTGNHCLKQVDCCERSVDENRFCYRHQSTVTARGIARRCELRDDQWTMTFQSRLTNGWLKPFTDVEIIAIAKKGVKRLVVFCPAFVADCLETLEEIEGRARESFLEHGGVELHLVPSLNSGPAWVETVVRLARGASGWVPVAGVTA